MEVKDNDLAAVHYSPLSLSIDELPAEAWEEAVRASPASHAIDFWLASSPVSGEAVTVTVKSPDSNKLKVAARCPPRMQLPF